MPPQRTRNQKSGESTVADATSAAGPSITFAADTAEPAATPERSPSKQAPIITHAQKQALIDNLQLEITERARKLRAQYALHAQGLRSRLEMRINRIPQSLRSTNIEELINKYAEQSAAPKSTASMAPLASKMSAAKHPSPSKHAQQLASSPPKARGTKRSSNEMSTNSDKENAELDDDLSLPKKRSKTTTTAQASSAASRATRGVSRKVHPSQVLSPKSHNSRTLPRSPVKGQAPSSSSGLSSPPKSYLARPVSPLKPAASVYAANAAAGASAKGANRPGTSGRPTTASSTASTATTGSLRGKRGAAAAKSEMPPPPVPPKTSRNRAASNSSNTSNTSSGTTIVTKKTAAKAATGTAGKKGIVGRVAGMAAAASTARKATGPAAKKAAAAPAAASSGGRSLRSRK